jgi:hypothetical protein
MRTFKYDVFVSCSHLDDLSPSDERGWVSTFVDNLKNQLSKRLGRHASVWYDHSMTGEPVFTETIENAIKDSGVLIAICSVSYLRSEWCTRVRECFAREGLTVGDQRRLLQVRLVSIPHEQWPDEFQGCAGFDFFSLRDFDPLGSPLDPTDPAFKDELRKIVVAIQSLSTTLGSVQPLRDTGSQVRSTSCDASARTESRMAGIFISYRRDDSDVAAGRLADDLSEIFGPKSVFRDVDSLYPGQDYENALESALDYCAVLLAVIGPRWSTIATEEGQRRLEEPTDWVRAEISRALARGIPVIPVLISGTNMPPNAELPIDIKPLLRRQGFPLDDRYWKHQLAVLALALEQVPGITSRAQTGAKLIQHTESHEFNVLKKTFMDAFKKCFLQIQLLGGRKDLHDQLHELQFRFFTPVSTILDDKCISIDHQLHSILREHSYSLSEIHENLVKIAFSNRVIPERELTWIKDLGKAHAYFGDGIRRIDLARMQAAIAIVDTILARWPTRINTQLTETARDLSLVGLAEKLQLLCDKSTTFKQQLGEKACELERSVSSISTLAAIHDDWQLFDEDLRLLNATIQSLRDIEVIWLDLKDKAANLYAVNPGNWTQRFEHLSGEMDLAIRVRDLGLAKGTIIRFTSAARERFYVADQDLKRGCSRLQQISAPIEAILSAPSW